MSVIGSPKTLTQSLLHGLTLYVHDSSVAKYPSFCHVLHKKYFLPWANRFSQPEPGVRMGLHLSCYDPGCTFDTLSLLPWRHYCGPVVIGEEFLN